MYVADFFAMMYLMKTIRCLRRLDYFYRNISCSSVSSRDIMNMFDKKCKFIQKERALMSEDVHIYDYLKDEVAVRLADRILDINRNFTNVADIGCGRGFLLKHMDPEFIKNVYLYDSSPTALSQVPNPPQGLNVFKSLFDEEKLELEDNFFDLVLTSLALHWINNLPGVFNSVIKCLKKDGAFLGTMFGGDTLYELRSSLHLAESERCGGISAHVSPFTEVSDVGGLLSQAGFTLLTLDTDEIIVRYPTMFELMYDLKGMGENNCTWQRSNHLRRDVATAASAIYHSLYGDKDDGIPATFQVIYFVGWKPDPSQPKPAQRGSASHSFKELNDLEMPKT